MTHYTMYVKRERSDYSLGSLFDFYSWYRSQWRISYVKGKTLIKVFQLGF